MLLPAGAHEPGGVLKGDGWLEEVPLKGTLRWCLAELDMEALIPRISAGHEVLFHRSVWGLFQVIEF